jgi:hypothetical protein
MKASILNQLEDESQGLTIHQKIANVERAIQHELALLRVDLEDCHHGVDVELDYRWQESYDEYLDGAHGNLNILGLNYSASYVLRAVDEQRYKAGFNSYIDQEFEADPSQFEDYQDLLERIAELESDLEDVQNYESYINITQ